MNPSLTLVTQSQACLDRARKEHELTLAVAAAMPAGSPEPKSLMHFGYCADHTLTFAVPEGADSQAMLSAMLQLYPPLDLVDLDERSSRSQKPRRSLRENELHSHVVDLYPVLQKHEPDGRDACGKVKVKTSLRWWTALAGVSSICVEHVGLQQCPIEMDRYAPDSFTYSTGSTSFLQRRLAPVDNASPAPLVLWQAQLRADLKAQALDARQLRAAHAWMVCILANAPMTAAEAVQQLGFEADKLFTPEGLQVLLKRLDQAAVDYDAAKQQQKALFAALTGHAQELLGQYSRAPAGVSSTILARLDQALARRSGLSGASLRALRPNRDGSVTAALSWPGAYASGGLYDTETADFTARLNPEGLPLQPQFIDCVYA